MAKRDEEEPVVDDLTFDDLELPSSITGKLNSPEFEAARAAAFAPGLPAGDHRCRRGRFLGIRDQLIQMARSEDARTRADGLVQAWSLLERAMHWKGDGPDVDTTLRRCVERVSKKTWTELMVDSYADRHRYVHKGQYPYPGNAMRAVSAVIDYLVVVYDLCADRDCRIKASEECSVCVDTAFCQKHIHAHDHE